MSLSGFSTMLNASALIPELEAARETLVRWITCMRARHDEAPVSKSVLLARAAWLAKLSIARDHYDDTIERLTRRGEPLSFKTTMRDSREDVKTLTSLALKTDI